MDPVTLIAIAAVVLLALFFVFGGASPKFELHSYQEDFLNKLAASQGTSSAEALQSIVDKAMSNKKVYGEIFDDFHCVHCGSVAPAEWIKTRKGDKHPVALPLSDKAVEFLKGELLVPVAKVGDPKVRQVVEGPRTSNPDKAVRCCIDWAIKKYGAVADGTPKPE